MAKSKKQLAALRAAKRYARTHKETRRELIRQAAYNRQQANIKEAARKAKLKSDQERRKKAVKNKTTIGNYSKIGKIKTNFHAVYSLSNKADIIKEYNKMVNLANKRLRELEQASAKDKQLEGILKFAYAKAQRDINNRFNNDKKRNTKRFQKYEDTTNLNEVKGAINEIVEFLESPTSTIQGTIMTYMNKVETINKKYGTNYDWKTYKMLWDSGRMNDLINKFGSDQAFVEADKVIMDLDRFKTKYAAALGTSTIDDDEALEYAINELMYTRASDL